ncbi:MAG TPA: 4-(cytidine 5'-diphospho)-2-C-methyl-D-erythritol kinase [Burkholderiales bacterium]|jgi:4-diphosphocytidyl-2-C-methyl-D-erythritol kinase|nr:4-(cytidine 5'-diphospho)-2-C-methyl-D-erythritol kinase [Burkholderiales bacterium]
MKWYPAPGKLNLFLHVLGRRESGEHAGYHELQTVFRLVDRADRVGIGLRGDGEIRFSGVYGEDNLCFRAAHLLRQLTGIAQGADLSLEKVLPVGGGMGGGSSDAATVLLVLNKLWHLQLPIDRLVDIGKKLGADVPLFVYGRNALGEGIGERLRALELPAAWYLVLAPQVSVSTKEIFSSALTGQSKALKIPPFFPGQGRNDLEAAVAARYPEVAAHLEWLRQRSPQARMTGSGACVFAEFTSEAQARALYNQLPGDMQGFVARGLDRHPLLDSTD